MKLLFITLLMLYMGNVSAEKLKKYDKVIQCRGYPKVVESTFYISESEIKIPEKIDSVIIELMRLDLSDKIQAISLLLPDDHHPSEGAAYQIKLESYSKSIYSKQANCLAKYYKKGDKIFYFEQEPNEGYLTGYVLMRSNTAIAVVITGGKQI